MTAQVPLPPLVMKEGVRDMGLWGLQQYWGGEDRLSRHNDIPYMYMCMF